MPQEGDATANTKAGAATRILVLVETEADAERARATGASALLQPFPDRGPIPLDDRQLFWADATGALDDDLLSQLVESGADTLIVDTGATRVLDRFSFADLSRIADACRACRLGFGFVGALEAPDVPRLLPLRPAFLGLRRPAGIRKDETLRDLVSLTEPAVSSPRVLRPDRVFIRDFVQDMEIGAYASERGRRQRVRFSIEAELAPSPAPRSVRDIYSYDRMMDAVRALTARAPEPFVETLAEMLAADILADRRVQAVTVRVEKLDLGPASAGAEIRRERP